MTSDDNVRSLSGNPVYHHPEVTGWEPALAEDHIEEISDHIERCLGPIEMVYHEIISDTVHIDVYHVPPSDRYPFHIMVTSGMSDRPMNVPEGVGTSPYVELMVMLPPDWKISQEAFSDERWYWPVRSLKFLARFPHKVNSWFCAGHTIGNGNPPAPFADNTKLDSILFLPPVGDFDDFSTLALKDGKSIQFLAIVPLYREELALKMNKGMSALLEAFDRHNMDNVIDPKRKNVAKRRFGIFGR